VAAELPDKFRQSTDTITDVVMRMRYTSVDGGETQTASGSAGLSRASKSSVARKDLRCLRFENDFPTVAAHIRPLARRNGYTIDKLNAKLPIFTKRAENPAKTSICASQLVSVSITAKQGGNSVPSVLASCGNDEVARVK
jgi:hypothetical protein